MVHDDDAHDTGLGSLESLAGTSDRACIELAVLVPPRCGRIDTDDMQSRCTILRFEIAEATKEARIRLAPARKEIEQWDVVIAGNHERR